MRDFVVLSFCLCAAACVPESTSLLEASGRDGLLGDRGPFGAALWPRVFRVRAEDPLAVDVVVPTLADGVASEGPFPPVVFIQGGLVDVARYHWLLAHIASRGFVVFAPHHVGQLAFFEQGNGLSALHAARAASRNPRDVLFRRLSDQPALIMGHSLGGVVASKAWLAEPGAVSHLALLASIPDPADDIASRRDGLVLAVAGAADARIGPDEVRAGADAFRSPLVAAEVEGLTHYAWTDDNSAQDLASDGTTDLALEDVRRSALFLVDALLADLAGANEALALHDEQTWPPLVTPLADVGDSR